MCYSARAIRRVPDKIAIATGGQDRGVTYAPWKHLTARGLFVPSSRYPNSVIRCADAMAASDYSASRTKDAPLFRSAIRRTGKLSERPMTAIDICRMMKRRFRLAKLSAHLPSLSPLLPRRHPDRPP